MKLKVYQQGGGLIYTPFIPEQQSTASTTSRTKSSDSDEDAKLDPLDKELLGLMKDQNLLPSDIQMIYNRLIQFQRKTQSLSSLPGFGGSDSYRSVMPGMLQIMNLVSQAKYNKQADDKIIEQMVSENAGNEFALDGYGRMYIQDKDGKIKKINPSEFDSEKHLPLSNSQLLYLRERNPELAFDGDVFEDMRNMVGMTSVSKEIDRIIKEFGTEEGQRYLSKETAQIFSDLNNPDGAYKLTMKVPSSGLKQAWKTIYDQLPINMQNLLKIRSAVSGDTPETYISDIVLHNSSTTQNIDYDATMSKAAGFSVGESGSDSEKLTSDTYLYRVASLNGPRRQITIAPKGAKIADTGLMITTGIVNGAVVDNNEKRLGNMSLSEMLQEAEAVKAADASTIVLGNKTLTPGEYNGIMFDSNQECNTVLLPYTYDKGRIVPDFDTFEKFNQLQRAIAGKFSMPQTEVARLANELGLSSDQYNYDPSTNSLNLTQTMYFLSFGAIVSDNAIDLSKDNKRFLEQLSSDESDFYKKEYENMVKYGKVDRKKSDLKVGEYKDNLFNRAKLYRGMIWMAMPDSYRGAHLSMNEYIDKSKVNNFGRRTEVQQQQNEIYNAYQQAYGNIGSFNYE